MSASGFIDAAAMKGAAVFLVSVGFLLGMFTGGACGYGCATRTAPIRLLSASKAACVADCAPMAPTLIRQTCSDCAIECECDLPPPKDPHAR